MGYHELHYYKNTWKVNVNKNNSKLYSTSTMHILLNQKLFNSFRNNGNSQYVLKICDISNRIPFLLIVLSSFYMNLWILRSVAELDSAVSWIFEKWFQMRLFSNIKFYSAMCTMNAKPYFLTNTIFYKPKLFLFDAFFE